MNENVNIKHDESCGMNWKSRSALTCKDFKIGS